MLLWSGIKAQQGPILYVYLKDLNTSKDIYRISNAPYFVKK